MATPGAQDKGSITMTLKSQGMHGLAFFVLFTGLVLADLSVQFSAALYSRLERQFGTQASARVSDWQQLLEQLPAETERQTLSAVNQFFNQRRFIEDRLHWQADDYWATPIEFLATDGGDCEDFSIAKYVSLRLLGVDDSKLRLMYVKALKLNQAHMVLAYYPTEDAVPLVLDNLTEDILPASERPDLLPVYSFNGSGLWLAKAQGRGRQVQGSGQHSLWQDLTQRIESGN